MTPINKEKSDLKILLLGFSFILLVGAVFFFKTRFFDQKNSGSAADDNSQSAATAADKFSSITVADLAKKINAKERLAIFDLRDADSFAAEHILDTKNASVDDLQTNLALFDKDGTYFFVDDLGLTLNEVQAMRFFKDDGFDKIFYLEGGLTQWKNEYENTIAAGDPYSLADQSKVSYIKSEELEKELTAKKFLYLIDTRDAAAYNRGHIPGAVNIALDDLEGRRHAIPLGAKIVTYDDNGMGAFQGAVKLFDAGILNVYALSDGLNTWKQKGFALTATQN